MGIIFVLMIVGAGIWLFAFAGSPSDRMSARLKEWNQRLYSYSAGSNLDPSNPEDTPAQQLGGFNTEFSNLQIPPKEPTAIASAAAPVSDHLGGAPAAWTAAMGAPPSNAQPEAYKEDAQPPHEPLPTPTPTSSPFILDPVNLSPMAPVVPPGPPDRAPDTADPGSGAEPYASATGGSADGSGILSRSDAASAVTDNPADAAPSGGPETKPTEIDIPGGAL